MENNILLYENYFELKCKIISLFRKKKFKLGLFEIYDADMLLNLCPAFPSMRHKLYI